MADGGAMKILMLNYPYLKEELRELGHQVVCAGTSPECNIALPPDKYEIDNILNMIPFEPEVIIFMDSVERELPWGLEKCQIPLTVFFLDAPINRFWQFPLAEMAETALFDQRPEAAILKEKGYNSLWFPLAADGKIYKMRGLSREYEITFVGGRNPATRGKRENILKAIGAHYNLRIFDGNPRLNAVETSEVYNRSRLVLNENLFPALNLRLFEAMASGSAVLTENNAPGLGDIFKTDKHLITYTADDLLDKIDYYLNNEGERENIALNGAKEIADKHNFYRRAQTLIEIIQKTDFTGIQAEQDKQSAFGRAMLEWGLKWGEKRPETLRKAGELLESSAQIHPTAAALIAHGRLEVMLGNAGRAVKYFAEAGRLSGDDFRPYLYAGIVLANSDDNTSAKQYLSKAAEIGGIELHNDDHLRFDTGEFHFFWGQVLGAKGEALEAGLMKLHFPMPYWSALEHFRRAAQIDRRYWEAVGDLLIENAAPDAAVQAYGNIAYSIPAEKMEAAKKGAYENLGKKASGKAGEKLLALCMIVKNEAENLKELLPAVKNAVDQIIIGDTGSSDGSMETARRFGADVFNVPWTNDFAAARNRTLEKVRCKYVIYLDGDDRIDTKELADFRKTLSRCENAIFYVKIENARKSDVCWQKRIFPHRPELKFQGAIHEQITADAKKYVFHQAPLTIYHQGYDTPEALQKKAYRNLQIIEAGLIEEPEDYYLHYHAARCRMNLGQDFRAVEHLQKAAFSAKAMAENPEIVEHSMILLAKNFQLSGDYNTAIKLMQNLIAVIPDSALAHYHLAVLFFEEQLYAECRREMEMFFQLDLQVKGIPVSVDKINGWGHYYLGRCYEHQGLGERALEEYKFSVKLLENPAKLYIDMARVYLKLGDSGRARQQLTKCLDLQPSSRIARKMLDELEKASIKCQVTSGK